MSLTSVLLILLSAAIHVGWNLMTKSSSNPKVFSALKGLPFMAMGILTVSVLGLEAIPPGVLRIALVSGVIHAIYMYALSTAYEDGDLSLVYPIVRSSPAFVPLAAWLFLGETISFQGFLGITIVVACILALQLRQLQSADGIGFNALWTNRDNLWAFLTLAMVVAYSLVDKEALVRFRDADALDPNLRGPVFFILLASISSLILNLLLVATGIRGFGTVLTREWKKILIASLGMMLSYSLILNVMQSEKVSYIVTLRQSSILMATILGWLVLKERHGRYRFTISIIMIVGFALVILAD